MTKVYLGSDQYEVYLASGMVIMTETEIDELIVESSYVEELKDNYDGVVNCIKEVQKINKRLNTLPGEVQPFIDKIRRVKLQEDIQMHIEGIDNISKEIEDILDNTAWELDIK